MKTDKEINEIIKQGLEEYAKAETKSEDTADVTFSKTHEEKMQKMFDDMRKENKSNKPADRELVIHIKFNWLTKVAVAVIVVGVFVSAVSTGIKAWRESKLNSYEGSGDYSWLLPNDTSEMYEKKTDEEKIAYVRSIFPNLSGEITEVEITNKSKMHRISFRNNEKYIVVKFGNAMSMGLDTDNREMNEMLIKNTRVIYFFEKGMLTYLWEKDGVFVNLYGNISEEEATSIFNTINYEKIETNF